MDDIDKAFDDIILVENRAQEEGYIQGLEAGKRKGYLAGKQLGLSHGTCLGSELGFYHGFATTWNAIETSNDKPKARVLKNIEALLELIASFPRSNPQDERIQDAMVQIRAKFKQVCSLLKITIDAPTTEKGVSF